MPEQSDYGWSYIKGSSQELALGALADHILFHGSRGPGKSDCQLARFARNVGIGYGSHWRGVIFDREYKNLDDLVIKSKRMFREIFGKSARFLESKADYKWVWATGEELLFRQFKKADDYWNYHGQEFPFIGWNELCKYPSIDPYETMTSCNRSSWTQEKDGILDEETGEYNLPPIPLEIFSTTNPYGPGHNWVKAKFIDVAPTGKVHKTTTKVFHPATKKEIEITVRQVAIFGSYKENPYLDPKYVAELESITDRSKRKAWLEGDWNVVGGGALDDLWNETVHVKKRFVIPKGWKLDRSFDWGSSHPFSVGWWAEANGEEATLPDGSKFCPPRGSLIRFAEWYGTERTGSNKGLKMSAKKIAEGVNEYENVLLEMGWIEERPMPGPADNQIRDVRESDVETIAKKMEDLGVYWNRSDKSRGSRKVGLQLIRDRLEASNEREGPGIYFMDNCRAAISTLPVLPRDDKEPDDVDTDAEDHVYDEVRYRVLASSNRLATKIDGRLPT